MFNHTAMPTMIEDNSNPSIYGNADKIVDLAIKCGEGEDATIAWNLIDLIETLTDTEGRIHVVQEVLLNSNLNSEVRGEVRKYFEVYQ